MTRRLSGIEKKAVRLAGETWSWVLSDLLSRLLRAFSKAYW